MRYFLKMQVGTGAMTEEARHKLFVRDGVFVPEGEVILEFTPRTLGAFRCGQLYDYALPEITPGAVTFNLSVNGWKAPSYYQDHEHSTLVHLWSEYEEARYASAPMPAEAAYPSDDFDESDPFAGNSEVVVIQHDALLSVE